MRTIEQYLPDHPFFAGLDGRTLALVAGCATNVSFAAGEFLFREGQPADQFFVVRRGRVAIEVHGPAAGTMVVDTADAGDVVGWSWLVPPYRWLFDARAVEATGVVAFDGACLRGKCEEDPRLGYELMKLVTQVMNLRLEAAQVRLLDLYGAVGPPMPLLAEPTALQPVGSAMVPRLFRLADRRQDTADTFTMMLEPTDGVPLEFIPGQFTMLSAFGVGEVPISVSSAANVERPAATHGA